MLLHEFGHQLACRQVGGQTHDIILWPLGGVAYVSPPQRPGAQLWSIAAGPLVNVALFPIFSVVVFLTQSAGWEDTMPDAYLFVLTLWYINTVLLAFNLLPIYPLDGGQILRSLLWFAFGRARSLMIATVIGLVGIVAFIPVVIWSNHLWYYLLAGFALLNCWGGLTQARALLRVAKLPRREGFACPVCKTVPPQARCGYAANAGRRLTLLPPRGSVRIAALNIPPRPAPNAEACGLSASGSLQRTFHRHSKIGCAKGAIKWGTHIL